MRRHNTFTFLYNIEAVGSKTRKYFFDARRPRYFYSICAFMGTQAEVQSQVIL